MIEFMSEVGNVLSRYGTSYLRGAGTTLVLALIGTLIGCLIGFAVGIVQTIPVEKSDPLPKRLLMGLVRALLRAYVELFRGTPMIVQAVFIYYGGLTLGLPWNGKYLLVGLMVVSINTGAYMAETVRGGILSVDPGQTEGAKAIGMNHFQTMIQVVFPQALRNIIPQIGNNFIINIKDTSVLSVISVSDLFFVHKGVVGALYTYFESATIVMVIYLTMTLTAAKLLRLWESKLDGPESYDLATQDTLAFTSGLYTFDEKRHKKGTSGNRDLDGKGDK